MYVSGGPAAIDRHLSHRLADAMVVLLRPWRGDAPVSAGRRGEVQGDEVHPPAPRTRRRATEQDDHEESDNPPNDKEDAGDPCRSPPRKRRAYKCGICKQQGHNKKHCPTIANR